MPIVLGGTNVLPGGIPQNRWYNDYGALQGAVAKQGLDALMAAFLGQSGGMFQPKIPMAPTAQNPGQLMGPQGPIGTGYNPSQMGQGITSPVTAQTSRGISIPQEAISGGVKYQQPTMSTQQLAAMQAVANLQKTQREMDPSSPENQVRTATAGLYKKYAEQMGAPAASGVTPMGAPAAMEGNQMLDGLIQRALSDDEEAITELRGLGLF